MQAVQSSHVFAVRSGFPPKAGGIGAIFPGEVALLENFIPQIIRHRHLSRRHGIKPVAAHFVHLIFLIRQLPRTRGAIRIDEDGGLDFRIAAFLHRHIEKEIDQCPLQARSFSDVEREAGSGYLGAALEVDEAVAVRKLPVGYGPRSQTRGAPPTATRPDYPVRCCRSARWDAECSELRATGFRVFH